MNMKSFALCCSSSIFLLMTANTFALTCPSPAALSGLKPVAGMNWCEVTVDNVNWKTGTCDKEGWIFQKVTVVSGSPYADPECFYANNRMVKASPPVFYVNVIGGNWKGDSSKTCTGNTVDNCQFVKS